MPSPTKTSKSPVKTSDGDKVVVAVRVRPLSTHEQGNPIVVEMQNATVKLIPRKHKPSQKGVATHEFTFDYCLRSSFPLCKLHITQAKVFDHIGLPVVVNAFDGFNTCVLAYGESGSGKTYTMMGGADEEEGLIPRMCRSLFDNVADLTAQNQICEVEASYYEICDEAVFDLFSSSTNREPLEVQEHKILGPHVSGLSECAVAEYAMMESLLTLGNQNKKMNGRKSHSILTLTLSQHSDDVDLADNGSNLVSRICLVDLASSDHGEPPKDPKNHSKGGAAMNKSLATLGTVIKVLGKNTKSETPIPYGDSVLTRLLKDCLGVNGNTKTTFIGTLSPAESSLDESLSTLRFADRMKSVVNKPIVNQGTTVKLIAEMTTYIKELREEASAPEQVALNEILLSQLQPFSRIKAENTARCIAYVKKAGSYNMSKVNTANSSLAVLDYETKLQALLKNPTNSVADCVKEFDSDDSSEVNEVHELIKAAQSEIAQNSIALYQLAQARAKNMQKIATLKQIVVQLREKKRKEENTNAETSTPTRVLKCDLNQTPARIKLDAVLERAATSNQHTFKNVALAMVAANKLRDIRALQQQVDDADDNYHDVEAEAEIDQTLSPSPNPTKLTERRSSTTFPVSHPLPPPPPPTTTSSTATSERPVKPIKPRRLSLITDTKLAEAKKMAALVPGRHSLARRRSAGPDASLTSPPQVSLAKQTSNWGMSLRSSGSTVTNTLTTESSPLQSKSRSRSTSPSRHAQGGRHSLARRRSNEPERTANPPVSLAKQASEWGVRVSVRSTKDDELSAGAGDGDGVVVGVGVGDCDGDGVNQPSDQSHSSSTTITTSSTRSTSVSPNKPGGHNSAARRRANEPERTANPPPSIATQASNWGKNLRSPITNIPTPTPKVASTSTTSTTSSSTSTSPNKLSFTTSPSSRSASTSPNKQGGRNSLARRRANEPERATDPQPSTAQIASTWGSHLRSPPGPDTRPWSASTVIERSSIIERKASTEKNILPKPRGDLKETKSQKGSKENISVLTKNTKISPPKLISKANSKLKSKKKSTSPIKFNFASHSNTDMNNDPNNNTNVNTNTTIDATPTSSSTSDVMVSSGGDDEDHDVYDVVVADDGNGLGVSIQSKRGHSIIQDVIEGKAAAMTGQLFAQDVILQINGKDATVMTHTEAVKEMTSGDIVKLRVSRPNSPQKGGATPPSTTDLTPEPTWTSDTLADALFQEKHLSGTAESSSYRDRQLIDALETVKLASAALGSFHRSPPKPKSLVTSTTTTQSPSSTTTPPPTTSTPPTTAPPTTKPPSNDTATESEMVNVVSKAVDVYKRADTGVDVTDDVAPPTKPKIVAAKPHLHSVLTTKTSVSEPVDTDITTNTTSNTTTNKTTDMITDTSTATTKTEDTPTNLNATSSRNDGDAGDVGDAVDGAKGDTNTDNDNDDGGDNDKQILDGIPTVDANGFEIPEWKRIVLKKQKDKPKRQDVTTPRKEHVPEWKREILKKRETLSPPKGQKPTNTGNTDTTTTTTTTINNNNNNNGNNGSTVTDPNPNNDLNVTFKTTSNNASNNINNNNNNANTSNIDLNSTYTTTNTDINSNTTSNTNTNINTNSNINTTESEGDTTFIVDGGVVGTEVRTPTPTEPTPFYRSRLARTLTNTTHEEESALDEVHAIAHLLASAVDSDSDDDYNNDNNNDYNNNNNNDNGDNDDDDGDGVVINNDNGSVGGNSNTDNNNNNTNNNTTNNTTTTNNNNTTNNDNNNNTNSNTTTENAEAKADVGNTTFTVADVATTEGKETPATHTVKPPAPRQSARISLLYTKKLSDGVEAGNLNLQRALSAARWVDKEIRKLISTIETIGSRGKDGVFVVKYGTLFKATENTMEALSGTLKTAKRKKVVSFEAEVLFQGQSDNIDIRLLKHEIEDSSIHSYTVGQVTEMAPSVVRKGKAFANRTQVNEKCASCGKTVYAMEYVGVSDKAFHKTCFKCCVCQTKLKMDTYATVNDRFYCRPHYEREFMASGGKYDHKR